ncbi:carbamoyl-phosphate synthase large subunit [Candidatus Saccharibacteria bacterium]|nr:carbamoyl-phosphate synthase large subunit [Candidatus Saccharibacteria bacterium]
MPLKREIKKVLVIGSGPIVIGQAAEFDYAGTQACKTLKSEGLEVVLVNSNPATIMTDKNMADKVYIEPLTVDMLKKIIEIEKPDSILPTLGGQTALNLAMELHEQKFLEKYNVKLLGTTPAAIEKAEDRLIFKQTMESIGQPCIESKVVENIKDAISYARKIGFPVVVRPAYTLGGAGGGIVKNEEELDEIGRVGLGLSRVGQILIEKSVAGWKEIEFEAIRDSAGNKVLVCSMENIDPVGVHTGDSIVVAPAQTLSKKDLEIYRQASFAILDELGIEGGCNLQFAVNPADGQYALIEVNPRLSRSSALASKATGYPIARVATKIAIGYTLDEIKNEVTGKTLKGFEPPVDYIVIKFPRWPFDKFVKAKRSLGTQMKATGEVMSIAHSLEAALMKAVYSLELRLDSFIMPKLQLLDDKQISEKLTAIDDERFFVVCEAMRRGTPIDKIYDITKIDPFFLKKIQNVIKMEQKLTKTQSVTASAAKQSMDRHGDKSPRDDKLGGLSENILKSAKALGFLDKTIATLSNKTEQEIKSLREKFKIVPSFHTVNIWACKENSDSLYYYSDYADKGEKVKNGRRQKVIVIGSGPIRIGQGIEFDYCSVHAVWSLKNLGFETIIINNNPETVSTDFDTADKLYFEPITTENLKSIIDREKPFGVIVQFGGQTAIKMTDYLNSIGVKVLGTKPADIDRAEDREKFDEALENINVRRPIGKTVFTYEEAIAVAGELGYPVLIRPSYVLGGQGMKIAYSDRDVGEFMDIINLVKQEHPILIDKYLTGLELEIDAICDGRSVLIPGIMQHVERAGVHSGDSISVYPSPSISDRHKKIILDYTKRIAQELNTVGLMNIQFILHNDEMYVIEVNPRSSRTIPYISKVTGVPMIDLAIRCIMGEPLVKLGYGSGLYKKSKYTAIKVPVFSFEKLYNVDTSLDPEMKSTGEVLGLAKTFEEALFKGMLASGIKIGNTKNILVSVKDSDKIEIVPIVKDFVKLGYKIFATENTANFLGKYKIKVKKVSKIFEEKPNIFDLINDQKIDFIINTPTKGKKSLMDGFKIRRKAVEKGIPCFTSLDTVRAITAILSSKNDITGLEPIDVTKI